MHLIVEIKARAHQHGDIRNILLAQQADFRGTDHQIDTYYEVPAGRLKLRQGRIENNLIYYRRADQSGPKTSKVHLYPVADGAALHDLLEAALPTRVVVDKQREIYFIDNVKFHLDTVQSLGTFVEIEAIDSDGTLGEDYVRQQCAHYIALFGIQPDDLLTHSYSDMLAQLPQ